MQHIDLPGGKPTDQKLADLDDRCRRAVESMKAPDSEAKLPIFFEFAGSPKSGKSTIIGIIAHFLRRLGVAVACPSEGASLRTPEPLKDDWLAFNTWSGCYALQNILVDSFDNSPVDVVLLDRGLFDIMAWMEFLQTGQERITDDIKQKIVNFFSLDLWRTRVNAVFLFTADYATSMDRESDCKLTAMTGAMMNAEKLEQLLAAYQKAGQHAGNAFLKLFALDTSYRQNWRPNFQMVAYQVANQMIQIIEEIGMQELLVTPPPQTMDGFNTDQEFMNRMCEAVLRGGDPQFENRSSAERSKKFVQVVPYALIKNKDGRYFRARRRSDLKRKELQRKLTLLAGGHAERRDWDSASPQAVFERCLRRELEEEFAGIDIKSICPLGFIYDSRNPVGTRHLAFIHEAVIGGKMVIRRQAIDKEFGREAIEWVDAEAIRACAGDLDPWSQLVANKLFDAPLPSHEPMLFSSMEAREDPSKPA